MAEASARLFGESEPPRKLHVVTPNGQWLLGGEYVLQAETANGQPLWKQSGGCWLFSGTNGVWIITHRHEAEQKDFNCTGALIFCKAPHGGVTPDRLKSIWLRLEGDSFCEDSDIAVTSDRRVHRTLRVAAGGLYSGGYSLFQGASANGMPIWFQDDGKYVLYSGNNGKWIIGGNDAMAKKFDCHTGAVRSSTPHGGVMPENIVGPWVRFSSSSKSFHEDSSIRVWPAGPLYIHCGSGQQDFAGEYRPVRDRQVHGQPLWEQSVPQNGHLLYSSRKGLWSIGGRHVQEDDFRSQGRVYCKMLHCGQPPDKVSGAWLRRQDDMYCEDSSISVDTVPATLHVVSPHGQQKLAGEYRRLPRELLNGHPVWQKDGDAFCLFSRAGKWCIAGAESLEGTQSPSGDLVSLCNHIGRNPDQVAGSWARLQAGGTLLPDTEIAVVAVRLPPERLMLASPRAHPRSRGVYTLTGERPNGHPVYIHSSGRFWLYSSTTDMWMIGGPSVKEEAFKCSKGVIHSGKMHGGRFPHEVPGPWFHLARGKFCEDHDIKVTVAPAEQEADAAMV